MKNKYGKSTQYMLDFVQQYIDGEMEQWAFDLDFDGRLIEHYPKMQREDEAFSDAFVAEVADRVDYARDNGLSDDECRGLIAEGLRILVS